MSDNNIRAVTSARRHGAIVKQDCTIVVNDVDGNAHIEVRPVHRDGIGPALDFYRVNGVEPAYLMTLRVPSVHALFSKLPIALAAARRLGKADSTKRKESAEAADLTSGSE